MKRNTFGSQSVNIGCTGVVVTQLKSQAGTVRLLCGKGAFIIIIVTIIVIVIGIGRGAEWSNG